MKQLTLVQSPHSELPHGELPAMSTMPFPERTFAGAAPPAHRWAVGKRVALVADDHDSARQAAVDILMFADYTVLTAENGREAVALFRKHADEISLLLLDVEMPILDGPSAFEQIRAIAPCVTTIFASGRTFPPHLRQLQEAGALKLLRKPYSVDQVLSIV